MKNAITFLTRKCPRECTYCAIRDGKNIGSQMTIEEWQRALVILEDLGVTFHLVLGNEPWLLGDSLPRVFENTRIPYGVYTTCPEPIFTMYRDRIFAGIDNLSCGVDWPLSYLTGKVLLTDSEKKSLDAWHGFIWAKTNLPDIECHASITLHKGNIQYIQELVKELSELGVFSVINFLHWDSDGGFDFFPKKEEMTDYLIPVTKGTLALLRKQFTYLQAHPGLLQNPQMLALPLEDLLTMHWHCGGNPYGGPTIDSDGTLRVCGYRKGLRTSTFSIFDLPQKEKEWRAAVTADALECPGCIWPCAWMFHYWEKRDPLMGEKVFSQHAGAHVPKDQWSKRRGKHTK